MLGDTGAGDGAASSKEQEAIKRQLSETAEKLRLKQQSDSARATVEYTTPDEARYDRRLLRCCGAARIAYVVCCFVLVLQTRISITLALYRHSTE